MITSVTPLRYTPDCELLEADEAETLDKLLETMCAMREKTYADSGHPLRSVHVKSHGLLQGTLEVSAGLPEIYAQGLFAVPSQYDVVLRLSTSPGDMLPDKISTPRGLALKIINVPGERLAGSEQDTTQDFLMVNSGPTFQVKSLKGFLTSLKPLAALTDKAEGLKVAASTVLRGMEKAIESVRGTSPKIRNMGGEPERHPLGETFFTQAPLRFGDYIAKLSLVPVSPELKALTGTLLDIHNDPLAIRHAVLEFFNHHGGSWEIRAQLCTDLESMPVEDSSVEWPEEKSSYVSVARLHVSPQEAWTKTRSELVDDHMSFSPWHGIAAHRPLGSLMRARKTAYAESARFRALRLGDTPEEPKTLETLPS